MSLFREYILKASFYYIININTNSIISVLDSATSTSDEESNATSEEGSDLSEEEDTGEKVDLVRTLGSNQFTQTHDVLGEWEKYTTVSIVFFD